MDETPAGCEWVVEALGCDPATLRDVDRLQCLFDRLIDALSLHAVEQPCWHRFPGEGGVTGLVALTESHLACHTYPEHRTATFNLYCCRTRPEWDWENELRSTLGAGSVWVSRIERGSSATGETLSTVAGGDL